MENMVSILGKTNSNAFYNVYNVHKSIYVFSFFLFLFFVFYILIRSKLDDLVMEKGGTPMRSIILTSWRSGSTFLGDVINAHPANFYHYEPLLDFGIVQIRGPPLAEEALQNIESLLNCDFHNLGECL